MPSGFDMCLALKLGKVECLKCGWGILVPCDLLFCNELRTSLYDVPKSDCQSPGSGMISSRTPGFMRCTRDMRSTYVKKKLDPMNCGGREGTLSRFRGRC